MKTIETMVTVTADGKVMLQLPSDIPPGKHQVVIVIDEQPVSEKSVTFDASRVELCKIL